MGQFLSHKEMETSVYPKINLPFHPLILDFFFYIFTKMMISIPTS